MIAKSLSSSRIRSFPLLVKAAILSSDRLLYPNSDSEFSEVWTPKTTSYSHKVVVSAERKGDGGGVRVRHQKKINLRSFFLVTGRRGIFPRRDDLHLGPPFRKP